MEILIISGMSGAGKSRAAICLEDSGYYIVDNLPAEMMVKFAEFCAAAGGRYDRLAFVYDVRAGEPFDRLTGAVEELRRQGLRCRLLFLEADTKTIINRYKETRRSHPLCGDGASIEEAVARERAMLAPVRAQADLVLDTSAFSAAKLRSTLLTLLGGGFAVLNFFLLGLTVQKMAGDPNEKKGKLVLQLSYSLRMLATLAVGVLGVKLACFSWVATVIPLLFPRLTILAMQILGMYKPPKNKEGGDEPV